MHNNLASTLSFFSGAFCYTLFGIRAQFIIRKEESKVLVLARRASYDKKMLARQVIPLAPGYRTALSSHSAFLNLSLLSKFWFNKENNAQSHLVDIHLIAITLSQKKAKSKKPNRN